ncbi:hypothetical protein BHE74_00041457 [Ensete ventricosum]|nr:hypothetical protein BHE74_00041457 [Ensete ventricosum]
MLSASRDGWPRPGHMQGGGLLWPRPPAKGWPIVARASPPGVTPAHGQTAGAIARGWPVVAQCLQGMAAARGQATGTTASGLQTIARKKVACRRRHYLQGLLPAKVATRNSGRQ